jgi:hypothetical protein
MRLSTKLSIRHVASGNIERDVFPLDDDVAGQAAEPELAQVWPQQAHEQDCKSVY